MITQAINRWLHKLFAWWPWKRSPETDDAHVVSTLNKGTTQESTFRTTVEGTISQPGATSVAVEHADDEIMPESGRSISEERPERVTPPLPAVGETANTSPTSSAPTARETSKTREDAPAPTPQQQLEFLQYLVKRGIVNEGFAEGHTPEQYNNDFRKK